MSSLTDLTLAQARDALKAKKISAKELAQAYLGAIGALNPALNAYITVTPERALADAAAADARIAKGQAGALEGIPIAIKDLFCTKGIQTTAGSKILKGFVPPYESSVTAKLWEAGAVMLGKTNLDEFAMGSSNTTSHYGNVLNPWGENLVPGGSSGGSAAAVSARMCLAATGTDTGGSIRQPAAFCGIVGIKPSYGRCSRWGTVAFASSLDQAGMFARNVRDAAITQTVICGHDPKDSTSAPRPVPDFEKALTGNIKGLKIGIPKEYRIDGIDSEIAALWDQGIAWLKAAGAQIMDVSLPHTKYALPTYYIIAPAEASSNLARYDGVRYGSRVEPTDSDKSGGGINALYRKTRADGFGREVKRRIFIGTYVLSAGYYDAYYKKAQRVRYLLVEDFKQAFEKVDALLTPTAPSAAFAIGEHSDDPVKMYLNDIFTIPTSMAGLPGISVPAGLSSAGLPLGLQVIGRSFDEETVFRIAGVVEEAAAFTALPGRVAV